MAPAHLAPLTACPAALQDRCQRTKRAVLEQPGLIDHPTVQGFGISIAPEPRRVSGCLPCKAPVEMGKWDGSHCKGRHLEGPRPSAALQSSCCVEGRWAVGVASPRHCALLVDASYLSHTKLAGPAWLTTRQMMVSG